MFFGSCITTLHLANHHCKSYSHICSNSIEPLPYLCIFYISFILCPWLWTCLCLILKISLLWCHNGRSSVSNHQPHDCLLNRLFRRRSKRTPKLRVTGLCAGNSPGTSELPAQMASNTENVFIWWRHHDINSFAPKYSKSEVTVIS